MSHPRSIGSLCLSLLLAAAVVHGQQPPAPESDKPAREQTIYIPYTKLRQIFEKEGRGVFVPYDEFQRLWKAAQSALRHFVRFPLPQ